MLAALLRRHVGRTPEARHVCALLLFTLFTGCRCQRCDRRGTCRGPCPRCPTAMVGLTYPTTGAAAGMTWTRREYPCGTSTME